jgi:hypothetical protein
MQKTLAIILTIIASTHVGSQVIKEKSIDVSIGFGYSAPNDDIDITGQGFFMQSEYVLTLAKWIDLRPYTGLILTKENKEDQPNDPGYKSIANALLFGAKTHLSAPIPWVAPYIEIGLGGSIGDFKTFTPSTNIDFSGLLLHVPISLGLELGPNHNFDIAFTYYFHNSVEQFVGAAAFGVSIPLSK